MMVVPIPVLWMKVVMFHIKIGIISKKNTSYYSSAQIFQSNGEKKNLGGSGSSFRW
jgi:hypothetical protein